MNPYEVIPFAAASVVVIIAIGRDLLRARRAKRRAPGETA